MTKIKEYRKLELSMNNIVVKLGPIFKLLSKSDPAHHFKELT